MGAATSVSNSRTGAAPAGATHSRCTVFDRSGRISGCRASKYGVSSGNGKRRDRRRARQAAARAKAPRGSTTASASVVANRWIHGAAVAVASAPGPTRSGATSGRAMPVNAQAGASSQDSSACTAGASRKVLCHPAR